MGSNIGVESFFIGFTFPKEVRVRMEVTVSLSLRYWCEVKADGSDLGHVGHRSYPGGM